MHFEACLIEAVKKQPVLYDRKHQHYNDKIELEKAWQEVLKDLRLKGIRDANPIKCRMRWRTLRDRYVRQITKTPEGEHLSEVAQRWEFTRKLNFLLPHLKKRKFVDSEMEDTKNYTHSLLKSQRNLNLKFSIMESPRSPMDENISGDSLTQVVPYEDETAKPKSEIDFDSEVDLIYENDIDNSNIIEEIPTGDHSNNVDTSLNSLLLTFNNFLQEQARKDAARSPNEDYFRVLDGYFAKLPPNELDRVKVEILNLVLTKQRIVK